MVCEVCNGAKIRHTKNIVSHIYPKPSIGGRVWFKIPGVVRVNRYQKTLAFCRTNMILYSVSNMFYPIYPFVSCVSSMSEQVETLVQYDSNQLTRQCR